MLANLLDSLELPAGARIAVQADKSVESLLLYLAVLRAGHVYLPLNTAYKSDELSYFIGNAEPSVLVCSPKDFPWLSRLAFAAGTGWVFSLGSDRSGSLLERASYFPDQHVPAQRGSDDLAAILYTSGTTGRSKGAMLSHGNLVSNALTLKSYWGWRTPAEGGDVLIHALPIFHVHGLFVASHGALLAGAKMLWLDRFDARRRRRPAAARHRLHGRADALRAHARRARARPRRLPQHAPLHQRLGADAGRDLRSLARAHRPHHPRALRHERDRDADLEPLSGARRRAPRRHRRLPPPRRRAAHPRRPRQHARHRRGRRHRGPRSQRLPRLLAHAGEEPRGIRRRRLVPHRRRRPDRRARLRHDRRAEQGPDHQRRLQRLSRRGRGCPQRAARRGRERGGRRAARRLRRGGGRGGGRARRRTARRRIADRRP